MVPDGAFDLAVSISHDAGEILMRYLGKVRNVHFKGVGDVVTEADRESEEMIRSRLASRFPDHQILGEEYGLTSDDLSSDSYMWAVDPLDGTSNYASGMPLFCVSVALLKGGIPVLGVVHDPTRRWTFSAVKGEGARLNGENISVNTRQKISSVSIFGISSDVIAVLPPYVRNLGKCRSLGSAALHLCHVAMGVWDGCLDLRTHLWDVAAGSLILEEAGGKFSDIHGNPYFPMPMNSESMRGGQMPFIASNGILHAEIIAIVNRR